MWILLIVNYRILSSPFYNSLKSFSKKGKNERNRKNAKSDATDEVVLLILNQFDSDKHAERRSRFMFETYFETGRAAAGRSWARKVCFSFFMADFRVDWIWIKNERTQWEAQLDRVRFRFEEYYGRSPLCMQRQKWCVSSSSLRFPKCWQIVAAFDR